MKNCTAFAQVGICRIVFEMQFFQNSSGGVFYSDEIWHGSEKKHVDFCKICKFAAQRIPSELRVVPCQELEKGTRVLSTVFETDLTIISVRIVIPV